MTHGIILTRVIVIAMWHDDILTRGNFLIFFFKFKKKIQKKIQKIEELIRGTPSNDVNLDLTERANVRRFNKKWDYFETSKNLGISLRF